MPSFQTGKRTQSPQSRVIDIVAIIFRASFSHGHVGECCGDEFGHWSRGLHMGYKDHALWWNLQQAQIMNYGQRTMFCGV